MAPPGQSADSGQRDAHGAACSQGPGRPNARAHARVAALGLCHTPVPPHTPRRPLILSQPLAHRHGSDIHRRSSDVTHTHLLPSPCPMSHPSRALTASPVCTRPCPRHSALRFSRLRTPHPQCAGPRGSGNGKTASGPPGESPGSPARPHPNPEQMSPTDPIIAHN